MMNQNLPKNIKKLLLSAFVFLLSIHCSQTIEPEFTEDTEQTGVDLDGTIFQITLNGESYPFDHADYGVYIPKVETVRGVLVLQHGCGMEQFGITRPYDIQYQSFAKKWH